MGRRRIRGAGPRAPDARPGTFCATTSAPACIRPVVKALSLTYVADALCDVISKGESLWSARRDIVVLAVTTRVFMALSVRFFRWE